MTTVSKEQVVELDALLKESADELEAWKRRALAAEARCEKLEAALMPFADYARRLDCNLATSGLPDTAHVSYQPAGRQTISVTLGDCRKALAALKEDG